MGLAGLLLLLFTPSPGNPIKSRAVKSETSPLNTRVDHFEIKDAILRDGVSELSLKNISGLHLGFEEVIRNKIQDNPRTRSPHFSLRVKDATVREVLDELCRLDARYTWAENGTTINIYPRATVDKPSYLFNLRIARIDLNNLPDPDQALTPLSKLFPGQQIGYFGAGLGNNTYSKPWTTRFEHVTVRQFINGIAEHMGSQTSWVWQGGEGERMFTFMRGGFHSR